MNIVTVVKRVEAELRRLGFNPAEYRITEINGDARTLLFDHATKTVRVGEPLLDFMSCGHEISFFTTTEPSFTYKKTTPLPPISFLDPVMPSFL